MIYKVWKLICFFTVGLEAELDNLYYAENDEFVCLQCGKTAKTKQNIRYHAETHLGHQYPCNLCGKLFKTTNSLTTHISRSHRQL